MLTLYFLSGLGSDKRIFYNLKLNNCKIKYIDWVEPDKNEPIQSYAKKLSEQIDTTDDFILIGLSFGGIVVQEMAQFVQPKKIILLSSVKNRNELPLYIKLMNLIKLQHILPYSVAKHVNPLFYRNMGAESKEEKELLKDFVQNISNQLLSWSVKKITEWDSKYNYDNLLQIHGDSDNVLPMSNFKADFIIKDGSHFMVYNKADKISEIIQKQI